MECGKPGVQKMGEAIVTIFGKYNQVVMGYYDIIASLLTCGSKSVEFLKTLDVSESN